jgi:hypothetical protein
LLGRGGGRESSIREGVLLGVLWGVGAKTDLKATLYPSYRPNFWLYEWLTA